MSRKPVKRRLKRFAVAATIYVAGVLLFASWSFHELRLNLLRRIDHTLSNAAYAAREIITDDYAGSLLQAGAATHTPSYESCALKLKRYAAACGLSAIGAAGRENRKTTVLIAGSGNTDTFPVSWFKLGAPLPGSLAEAVQESATGADGTEPALYTFKHPDYGILRTALLYEPLDSSSGLIYVAATDMVPVRALLRNLAIRAVSAVVFLLLLAIPLVVLFNRSQQQTSMKLAELNEQLQQDVEGRKAREEELRDAIRDLERFTAVAVGRESRIFELKNEVNELCRQLNLPEKYNTGKTD